MELCLGTVQFGLDYGIQRAEILVFSDYVRNMEYLLKDIDILRLLYGE